MKKKLLVISILFIMFFGINVNAASVKELNLEKVEGVKLSSSIDTYNSAQSIIVTDKYLVVMLTDTKNDNKNALYIYKNNNGSFTYYKTIKNRHYGHGNDMTYNSKTNEIVIINENKAVVLNADNFKQKKEISIGSSYTNIAYNKSNNNYYLGSSNRGLYNYDSSFKSNGGIISSSNYRGNQGVSVYKNSIYLCNYIFDGTLSRYSGYGDFKLKESLIFKYNKKGKLNKIYHIAANYKELESIDFWNDTAYLLFQRGGKFKVYKATNIISDTNYNVSGEIEDMAIIDSNIQTGIKEIIDNNTTIEQPSIDTNTNNNVNTTTNLNDTNQNINNNNSSNTVVESQVEVNTETEINSSTSVDVEKTDTDISNNNSVNTSTDTNEEIQEATSSVEETNYEANKIDDNDIEEVVEVPNTKSRNVYFTIIGLLTIISGIIFEMKYSKNN